ncbi:hypothetical protein GUITHDRAFT_119660 [Guillardia theta CCMP2712]|uniref:Uncharacterized protein n=1 Tax=Guillardia theta (strain CCMP2712) TaxID=905079 RepID=L1ID36_GUITC|nr:hypothetical protein GUITHDRAFT_119660 [Guillardia theta CCMP2712]EKX34166.1 hypothetical protein GUITHDRAFT_119660 [Guillardia theta CCMP2712]|eukprot:XP_005821146.1 hypothetical protein GUITHDRAFT_119660 [Guillardia theta CCMP2712]
MFADVRQYVELATSSGLDAWAEEYLGHGKVQSDAWTTEYLGQDLNQKYPTASQFQFVCSVSSTGVVNCPTG